MKFLILEGAGYVRFWLMELLSKILPTNRRIRRQIEGSDEK